MILSCLASVVIATVVCLKSFQTNAYEYSSLLLENVEALSDNESEGKSECKGWFGRCSFKCTHCGYEFSAIGSTFVNNHKCSQ